MSSFPTTQYQHYIPQFLLRQFAISSRPDRKDGRRKWKKTTADKMVNAVNLAEYPPELTILPVRRIFGQQDMYKDDSRFEPKDQMRMERKLGDIERSAGRIIARIVDAHKAGKDDITLSRSEKDLLRKFLFVMKYRGLSFFRRFNHKSADTYNSNDRTQFLDYMRLKGFQRPLDVWFDNLMQIIDIPMDPAGDWINVLHHSIYPDDAAWLFANIRTMYLSFVTPAGSGDEFILTENAFSIFEGQTSYSVDRFTGKQTLTAYTESHILNIITPHLAMILRSNIMPEALEDMDPDVLKWKADIRTAQAQMHTDPECATSLLEDLPVAKARNSYSVVNDGHLELAEGADGTPRNSDTFKFIFFPLESRHVQTINTVMLDQAQNISTLIFKSGKALRKALEFYLSWPPRTHGQHSLKTITDLHDDPMLLLFRKLEHVARLLGSDVKAEYHVEPLMEDGQAMDLDKVVAQVLQMAKPTVSDSPCAMATQVLIQVTIGLRLNVKTIYALDMLLGFDGRPSFPDLVYEAVHAAEPISFNEHTKQLRYMKKSIWRALWDVTVQTAHNFAGDDDEHDIDRSDHNSPAEGPSKLGCTTMDATTFAVDSVPVSPRLERIRKEPSPLAAQQFSGFSQQGLARAFAEMGCTLHLPKAGSLIVAERGNDRNRGTESPIKIRQTLPTLDDEDENEENSKLSMPSLVGAFILFLWNVGLSIAILKVFLLMLDIAHWIWTI